MDLRIKEIMNQRNVTSAWLADKIGISKVAISNIVTGKSSPTLENLCKISDALNVSIAELVGEKESYCRFFSSDQNAKYRCCFVLSSNVSKMTWNVSYEFNTQVLPNNGDILDFSAFADCDESIIKDHGTKYFIVDKKVIFPMPDYEMAEFDVVLFISPYKY